MSKNQQDQSDITLQMLSVFLPESIDWNRYKITEIETIPNDEGEKSRKLYDEKIIFHIEELNIIPDTHIT